MKITQIEVIPVWYEPTDAYHKLFGSHKAPGTMVHAREEWFAKITYKENVLVKIHTDEGLVGWGEAPAHPVTSETLSGLVSTIQLFGKLIQGMDPFHIGPIHAKLDNFFLHGNMGARAAMDIALYDLMGKASGQPVYKLLGGGFQTRFGLLGTMPREEPQAMAERAAELITRGYTCFEPKMTGQLESLEEDARRLRAVLDAVPQRVLVVADPNQTWGTPKSTIELLQRHFSGVPNLAVEQPIDYHDLAGLELITRSVTHKVVADEAATSIPVALEIAARRAADMISLKLGKNGGFYKALQMMRIAEAAGLEVRVDWTQGSRLLDTATAHLHACVRLVGCDPGIDYHLRIKEDIVAEGGIKPTPQGVEVPDAPGLGLTVDEDLVKHLQHRKE
jgi:L-alanine-DL-glutamate epimerase-like enolase superfamily enzyme